MTQYAVLTAIGEDRPGLVDAVSSFILRCGCNVEDSRMAILGGEFAMLILVGGEPAAIERVRAGAEEEGRKSRLTLQLRQTRGGERLAKAMPYEISAYSLDHPGIVQRVAHFLAQREINIRALDTTVRNAPHTGEPLFSLRAVVDVPAGQNVAEVRKGLADIGAAENIDFEMRPAEG